MNVGELREALEDLDPNMEVILQKNAGGNEYSPLMGPESDVAYVPETTYSGKIYDMGWSAEDARMSEDDWETIKNKRRALILYPTN